MQVSFVTYIYEYDITRPGPVGAPLFTSAVNPGFDGYMSFPVDPSVCAKAGTTYVLLASTAGQFAACNPDCQSSTSYLQAFTFDAYPGGSLVAANITDDPTSLTQVTWVEVESPNGSAADLLFFVDFSPPMDVAPPPGVL